MLWLTKRFRDITDRTQPITEDVIDKAKEHLILRMDTHINALTEQLNQPRVRDVINAIISGSDPLYLNPGDIRYVRDLGLIKEDSWQIANPIYQQVIPRALTYVIQELIFNKASNSRKFKCRRCNPDCSLGNPCHL
jgi:hypothetical protein